MIVRITKPNCHVPQIRLVCAFKNSIDLTMLDLLLPVSVSEALGANNWLLLAAIISSSFVMFLILLGIITRYYIYPIERNGDAVYNYTFKVLWDMFLAFACICISSSFVFLGGGSLEVIVSLRAFPTNPSFKQPTSIMGAGLTSRVSFPAFASTKACTHIYIYIAANINDIW